MFFKQNKNNNVYPCKPQFYYINVVFEGVKIILMRFRDEDSNQLRIRIRCPREEILHSWYIQNAQADQHFIWLWIKILKRVAVGVQIAAWVAEWLALTTTSHEVSGSKLIEEEFSLWLRLALRYELYFF